MPSMSRLRTLAHFILALAPLLLCSVASADGRPLNKTLWVAMPVDLRAQFLGIPISQNMTTPEMSIYFANNGTAYITLYGSKESSKGLVLAPSSTITEIRNQAEYIVVKIFGQTSDMYIELSISAVQPNYRLELKADWRVNLINNTCTIIDRHFALSVPGNPLLNSALNTTVGTAACKLYPGRAFL